nr:alpha/beta hydrolase [Nocardioides sp. zg-DK7169]
MRTRILGAGGAAGLALAGTAYGVAWRRRRLDGRAGEDVAFGSLRSDPLTVVADDGVPLHVEIDEPDAGALPLTVVLVHGYALNLDCWHFQRAALRGRVRTVLYDQRSHGRSGRSSRENATIDQLGEDLRRVLEEVVPEGPVLLVGHSMGGMSVVAFAEQHPHLFHDRITGACLISTTAGGLDVGRLLLPVVPAKIGLPLARGTIATLARRAGAVDGLRRAGRSVATVATDLFAFGDKVPTSYVEFVDQMLSATPFEVVAGFFPSFGALDKFHAVDVLSDVPTLIMCGTADRVTSIGHSRKLHSRIRDSRLVELDGAGHMVILERHQQINDELDDLIDVVLDQEGTR